jgi:protein-tyrosine phosphatase
VPDTDAVIDLHCHILPGVDDGAADLADSLAMGRQADADGIELVCGTPHIRHDHHVRIDDLPRLVDSVNREYERAGLAVRVAGGGEVAETEVDGLSKKKLEQLSLGGGGRWLLVEPAPGAIADSLIRTTERLGELGFRCVIAHPERHLDADTPALLARLVEAGALVQVTAEYLACGHPGEVLELAERGLVHVLGSDAHSACIGRPVRLSHGYARLAGSPALAPHAEWISQVAPRAIVRGEDVDPPFECR